jgi:hypothetical protein
MDVLLLGANGENVFTESLPSNDHIRHDIKFLGETVYEAVN